MDSENRKDKEKCFYHRLSNPKIIIICWKIKYFIIRKIKYTSFYMNLFSFEFFNMCNNIYKIIYDRKIQKNIKNIILTSILMILFKELRN